MSDASMLLEKHMEVIEYIIDHMKKHLRLIPDIQTSSVVLVYEGTELGRVVVSGVGG